MLPHIHRYLELLRPRAKQQAEKRLGMGAAFRRDYPGLSDEEAKELIDF